MDIFDKNKSFRFSIIIDYKRFVYRHPPRDGKIMVNNHDGSIALIVVQYSDLKYFDVNTTDSDFKYKFYIKIFDEANIIANVSVGNYVGRTLLVLLDSNSKRVVGQIRIQNCEAFLNNKIVGVFRHGEDVRFPSRRLSEIRKETRYIKVQNKNKKKNEKNRKDKTGGH